jgi:hypothetical protein
MNLLACGLLNMSCWPYGQVIYPSPAENNLKNLFAITPVTFSELCTSKKMRNLKVGMG